MLLQRTLKRKVLNLIKRKTIETVEEYDDNGVLKNRTITETTEDDDSPQRDYVTIPYDPSGTGVPWWAHTYPEVTCELAEPLYSASDFAKEIAENLPGAFKQAISK